jgi:uncharacterized protein DUF6894
MLPPCWSKYAMPTYYFHLKTGDVIVEDPEGSHLPDVEAAREYAVLAARELLAHAIHAGRQTTPDCVVVIDAEGRELLTVSTTEVLPESLRKLLR